MPNSITAIKKPKIKRLTFHNPSKKCALSLLQTVRPLPSSTKVSGALPPAAASTRKERRRDARVTRYPALPSLVKLLT